MIGDSGIGLQGVKEIKHGLRKKKRAEKLLAARQAGARAPKTEGPSLANCVASAQVTVMVNQTLLRDF